MAHNSIEPADHGRYYEGDAIHIPFVIYDKNGDNTVDISGSTVDFYLKESRTDSNQEALLSKSSDNAGEAELTDAVNGEAKVYIDTGDTEGVLDDADGVRSEEDEFFWVFRVTDADGNRVTTVEGTWMIHAS